MNFLMAGSRKFTRKVQIIELHLEARRARVMCGRVSE